MTIDAPTRPTASPVKHQFRAMNSDIELFAPDPGAARRIERARCWLAAYEGRFSRFRAESELSRLNAAAGRPFHASPALYRLVERALALAERSGGLFDPTVLPALDAAGYNRSFDLIAGQRSDPRVTSHRFSWRDVSLDRAARTIAMPSGCRIDLGGIGKGWAVDRMARILGPACLVNAGGDVYAGAGPDPDTPWRIGVTDPFEPEQDVAVLALTHRGVATSSTLKRRWQCGDIWAHHLIDPRTGRPSTSDLVQVTVIAPTATEADYHAKVALLLGSEEGLDYLNREPGVEGIAFRNDGASTESQGFDAYVEPEPEAEPAGGA